MTIDDIINADRAYLTPADIVPILGCDPQSIRVQAHKNPQVLGYPVIIIGRRIRIPRIPFLIFLGYDTEVISNDL